MTPSKEGTGWTRRPVATAATTLLLIGVLMGAPLLGSTPLDLVQVWRDETSTHAEIFWSLRVPRVLLAAMAGAALAAAGASFQAIFRNDLATPFTLGIASGASLGAVIAIHLGLGTLWWGLSPLPLCSFVGAAAVVALVFGISRSLGRRMDTVTLLLTGVTLSFLCSAMILLIQYLADFTGAHRMIRWMMGGLDTVGYATLWQCGPLVALGLGWTLWRAPVLDHLLTGDTMAASRGVRVRRERALGVLAASLMTGSVIAFTGPIGFVGLIVPHAVKRAVGGEHRWVVPLSTLAGASFLPLCDAAARTLIAPAELPVGVLTALLGAPFFLLVLLRHARGARG